MPVYRRTHYVQCMPVPVSVSVHVCLCVCVKIANVFCIALHTENKHYYPGAIMRRLMCVRQEGAQEQEGAARATAKHLPQTRWQAPE